MKNPFSRKLPETKDQGTLDTVLQRLIAAQGGGLAVVTPENCLMSPTVQALHTAITNRISSTPIHVYQTKMENGKESKQVLPTHPVALLLKAPNKYQTNVNYLADMASVLVRYNKFIAVKGQGTTGPIRELNPIKPSEVIIERDENFNVTFKRNSQEWSSDKIHYIRGPARDFVNGESIVENVKTAIALEIACENYGATFFENGAIPLLIFKYMAGVKGFKDSEGEAKFMADFQAAFSGASRNKAFLLPAGIDEPNVPSIDNEKAQFLDTRKMYQTVIAGAWNVPPHLVGNLENGHYNNVEQQDKDFTINVLMPYFMTAEAAMERDLLSQAERESGIIIRFNMDATLRASYIDRMQGYESQIRSGMKTPNECRAREGDNPADNEISNSYYYSANLIREGNEPTGREDENADTAPEPE